MLDILFNFVYASFMDITRGKKAVKLTLTKKQFDRSWPTIDRMLAAGITLKVVVR